MFSYQKLLICCGCTLRHLSARRINHLSRTSVSYPVQKCRTGLLDPMLTPKWVFSLLLNIDKRGGYYPGPKTPPRKPNFDYSGDINTELPPIDPSLPRVQYEEVQELKSSTDELTKKLLSLEYAPHQEVIKYHVNEVVKKVQRHELDLSSPEVRIAQLTIKIRNGIRHCMDLPKDKVRKSRLVEQIQKRKSFLNKLRKNDYQRFEWLLEVLNIKWVPYPEHPNILPTKKDRRRDAVIDKAVELRTAKMEVLRKALSEEKELFIKEKLELLQEIDQEMASIEEEETSLDMSETASEPLLETPHVSEKFKSR